MTALVGRAQSRRYAQSELPREGCDDRARLASNSEMAGCDDGRQRQIASRRRWAPKAQ